MGWHLRTGKVHMAADVSPNAACSPKRSSALHLAKLLVAAIAFRRGTAFVIQRIALRFRLAAM